MRREKLSLVVAACVLMFGLWTPANAHADTIAVNFTNTTGLTLDNPPFTLGWSFDVNTDITVTSLGLFDDSQDGLVESHEVGLWDSLGNLLVSTTVPDGTTATLIDKFRFVSVASINLLAGQTFFIGALFTSGSDATLPGGATGFTTASEITFGANRFASGATLSFPGGTTGTAPAFFGPNFEFEVTQVPEPATLLLVGMGLVAGARARRRTLWPRTGRGSQRSAERPCL